VPLLNKDAAGARYDVYAKFDMLEESSRVILLPYPSLLPPLPTQLMILPRLIRGFARHHDRALL